MKKDKKTLSKIFWFSLLVLFMSYATLFISGTAGYYEYTQQRRTTLTEKQIKKFEEDINSGKNIDLNDYLVIEENFQNKKQRMGSKLSETIGKTTKTGITEMFKILNKIVDN